MQDFPPVVPEFRTPAARSGERAEAGLSVPAGRREHFQDPDTRSPVRFIAWLMAQQAGLLIVSSVVGVFEWLPGSVGPFVVGKVIDEGITQRDLSTVFWLSMVLLALALTGVAAGVTRHTLIVRTWLITMFSVMMLVTRKTTQLGHVLPQRVPTGEVLSVSSNDTDHLGALTEIGTRAVGALVSYLVIAGLVLSTSPRLGLVVLLAAPLLVVLAMPLLRPLERRQQTERTRSSELTSLATDIVAGLRILRGIGGERTFARNYEDQSQQTRAAGVAAGRWQAATDAVSVLFSGLFLVVLTWLGAREVIAGRLSIGELISFFGYAVFMIWPIQTFFELAQKWVRAVVAARKTSAALGQQPPWSAPDPALQLPTGASIRDAASGFVGQPGRLTMVVSGVPDEAAALADRLGRYLPDDSEPPSLDIDDGVKGRAARRTRERRQRARAELALKAKELADRSSGVSLGSVDLADAVLAEVRDLILVVDTKSQLFAGTLQDVIDPHGRLSLTEAETALHIAAAEDVFEALPGGWQGVLEERARGLSGGQRQRVILARALAVDPEILILVEPTSAVDAHTEALIASRLAAHRAGRTTIVMSASPLLLHYADEVALLKDGKIVEVGSHHSLLETSSDYRAVVSRTLENIDV
ncbi:MAG TPA: ABC transporter ATP-binding protein [Propionibacteriaceae bacterium]|nr:ABC transporter ATP-binding protein [Propionibacteriaceae bacterium]